LRKLLTRALVIAALSGAGMTAFADNVSIPDSLGIPYYARGPRIIHVPQPGDDLRDSRASLRGEPENFDDDAVSVAPPPRRAMKPAPQARPQKTAKTGPHQEPLRRKPYSASLPEPPPPPPPEPAGPRRALLSAPPPPPISSLSDGPTPIRPTPRFTAPMPEPAMPTSDAVTEAIPTPENAVVPDTSDDHLPPPGDPRLAPPEPGQ